MIIIGCKASNLRLTQIVWFGDMRVRFTCTCLSPTTMHMHMVCEYSVVVEAVHAWCQTI